MPELKYLKDKKIVLVDNNNTAKVFDQLQIPYTKVATVAEAVKAKAAKLDEVGYEAYLASK